MIFNKNCINWFSPLISQIIPKPSRKDVKTTINNIHTKNELQTFHKQLYDVSIHKKDMNKEDSMAKFNISKEKAICTINKQDISDKQKIIKLKTNDTRYMKKINNIDKTTKCIKWKLTFNTDQTKILLNYINECTKLYNICVDIYSKNNDYFNESYSKIKIDIFKDIYKSKKPAPYDTLTDIIREFCSNLKSCKTNLKNENINHFDINYIDNKYKSILISKKGITTKGIFPTILKKNNENNFKNIENKLKQMGENFNSIGDSRLKYIDGNFYICIPVHVNKKETIEKEPIVAIDPGEKKFISFYGFKTCGYIGDNTRCYILKEEAKIRQYQRLLSKKINKNGKKLRNIKKIKKKLRNCYRKIRNYVNEIHNKSALFLCRNYENIMIPKFETQSIIKKSEHIATKSKINNLIENNNLAEAYNIKKQYKRKIRLNGRVKFVLQQLSHYRFRQHLINKANEYGCKIDIVSERHTSGTCTFCGQWSSNYEQRIKKCICNKKIDRDLNGSRNILMKNFRKIHIKGIVPR